MARARKKKIGFKGLSNRVTREYERKGVSASTARKWGRATAGKVRAEQRRKRG